MHPAKWHSRFSWTFGRCEKFFDTASFTLGVLRCSVSFFGFGNDVFVFLAFGLNFGYHRLAATEDRALVGTNSSAVEVEKQARGC